MPGEMHEQLLEAVEINLGIFIANLQLLTDLVIEVLEQLLPRLAHRLVDFEAELKLELIDRVIPEPSGGNHWAPRQAADNLRSALLQELTQLQTLSEQELLDQRYAKFRRMGRFLEAGTQDPSLSS